MVSIIVATSPSNVIAVNGKIPWKCPADMRHFKKTTIDNNVIMGRKTWDTLKNIPLVNRNNFVVTRNIFFDISSSYNNYMNAYIRSTKSIDEAIYKAALVSPESETFIIGGSEIYNQCLEQKLVDKIYLSVINEELIDSYSPNSDIKFFHFEKYSEWKLVKSENKKEFKLSIFEKVK